MKFPLRFFTFIFLLKSIFLTGQDYRLPFDHIDTYTGLSSGSVNNVLKDSKGFIWIGTNDGLNFYDGYNIKVFKSDAAVPGSFFGNSISSLAEDGNGTVWIGTEYNGFGKYNWSTNAFEKNQDPAISVNGLSNITVIRNIDKERLLIGTRGGLIIFNTQTFEATTFLSDSENQDGLSNNIVLDLVEQGSGKFWVATGASVMDLFDVNSGTFEHLPYDEGNTQSQRKSLLIYRDGTLWIGTEGNGLYKLDPSDGSVKRYLFDPSKDGINSNIIRGFHQAKDGNIWIATDGGGINVLDPLTDRFRFIKNSPFESSSLSSNAVYEIYEDESGIIWVSTFRGGVNVYSPIKVKFEHYKNIPGIDNSLSFNSVLSIKERSDGKIWIGTDGGGLDLFDPESKSFTHFKHSRTNSNSISGDVIKSIYIDNDGLVWLGTYAAGITTYDPSTNTFNRFLPEENNPNSLRSLHVWHFNEDSKGNFWVGYMVDGLDLYDKSTGTFEQFLPDEEKAGSLFGNSISCMLEDSQYNLWVGTRSSGLNLLDSETRQFTKYLAGFDVRCIYEDQNKNVLVGTTSGLYVLKGDEFELHPANDLLPTTTINNVLEDQQQSLWISTNKGMSKYMKSPETILNFDRNDGVQGDEFNYTAAITGQDGYMYFGGTEGFNRFSPESIKISDYEPNVVITSFKLFGSEILQNDTVNDRIVLNESILYTDEITLTHEENIFSFEFSSLDFSAPFRNRYAYMLEGFDENWVETDANLRTATYMNLPPSTYDFKVKGSNSDGVWSSKERMLKITILPPWWEKWWVRLIGILLLVAILYAAYQWRIRLLNKQRTLLNEEIKRRTSELRDMISVIKENSEKIKESGNDLKQKSRILSNDAKAQTETAKNIEGDIVNVIDHTRKNDENAKVTNEISQSTVEQLEQIRTDAIKNIDGIKAIFDKTVLLDEIFGQTNILALNAAVEAANAGQYGAGFSVIASEVKNLAERSNEAARQIAEMAKSGVTETEKVGNLIVDFIPELQKSANLINEISQSSEEQRHSIEEVNESMKSFLQVSEKNLSMSEQIFAISSELENLSNHLGEHVEKI